MDIDNLKIAYSPPLKYFLSGKIIDYKRDFFNRWEFIVYGTASC